MSCQINQRGKNVKKILKDILRLKTSKCAKALNRGLCSFLKSSVDYTSDAKKQNAPIGQGMSKRQ